MKNKLSIKQRIKACFILLVSGSLPSWWWSDLSNKFYESKIAHDYRDGKFDYRTIRAWFLEQWPLTLVLAEVAELAAPKLNWKTKAKQIIHKPNNERQAAILANTLLGTVR